MLWRMGHRLALALASIVALCLTGCAANSMPAPTTAPPAASESQAPAQSSGPQEPAQSSPAAIGITSTGLTVTYPDRTVTIEFDDVAAALELFEEISSTPAITSPGPAPSEFTFHDWEGVRVIEQYGNSFSVYISAPTIGKTRLETAGGVSVGSSSDAVLAAGGTSNDYDPSVFQLLPRDIQGTDSLVSPGQVGQEYVLVVTEKGVVTKLMAPSNDFSDL